MASSINNLLDTPLDEPFAIDHLQHATDRNRVLKPARTGILKSWDGFQELEIDFFQIHESLSVLDGVMMRENCCVVPYSLENQILQPAHEKNVGKDILLDSMKNSAWRPHVTRENLRPLWVSL